MHRGVFHREGTVAELIRTLPSIITFTLPPYAPALPIEAKRTGERWQIESTNLPKDLYHLLGWAYDNGVELRDLEAGATRLDDVFRAIES